MLFTCSVILTVNTMKQLRYYVMTDEGLGETVLLYPS